MIEPSHRVMLQFDIRPDRYEQYYRYMLREFVPTMQELGLHMIFAWQVLGSDYPERQVDLVAENAPLLRAILTDDRFEQAEDQLKAYTLHYRRKIVRFENRYQL